MRKLSRRALLRGGAILGASFGAGLIPAFARRALGEEGPGASRPKTLCFLFLRGALDGLHAVQPFGEARFAQLRPDLALPAPDAQKRNGKAPLLELGAPGFGLHPAMARLLPIWREGSLALVHAVGSPDGTRSHFDAQDMLELGTPGRTDTADGWLARALGDARGVEARPGATGGPSRPAGDHLRGDENILHANQNDLNTNDPRGGGAAPGRISRVEAVALTGKLPRSLQGDAAAIAFSGVEQLRLRPLAGGKGGELGQERARAAFAALYSGTGGSGPGSTDSRLAAQGQETFEALQLLDSKLGPKGVPTAPDANYPNGSLGGSLKQLAQLIKSEVGLRVGCAEVGGWDTHAGQPGVLERNLGELAQALAAFHLDLGQRADDVVLIAATEFGRTVRQNGAQGTDHGHASVAFVLGGGVAGGKLHGRWPGLADEQLYEKRDLAVTTDLRAVLLAAAEAQLGPLDRARVFPGFTGAPLAGLLRG